MKQTSYFPQHVGEADFLKTGKPAAASGRSDSNRVSTGSGPLGKVVFAVVATQLMLVQPSAFAAPQIDTAADIAKGKPSDAPFSWTLPSAPHAWPRPSERAFSELAQRNPALLESWIASGELRQAHLSFAAEALGEHGGDHFVATLLRLADHNSPMVREGAIYGLAHHASDDVVARLRRISEEDPSQGVRHAAANVLEDLPA